MDHAFQSTVELMNGKEVKITRLAGRDLPACGQKVFIGWEPGDSVVMPSVNQQIFSALNNFDITRWEQT